MNDTAVIVEREDRWFILIGYPTILLICLAIDVLRSARASNSASTTARHVATVGMASRSGTA